MRRQEDMHRTRPRVVYWDNIPAPYAVERYNTLADRGILDFSVWFARRTDSDRSWDVDESSWRFESAYVEDPGRSLKSATEFTRRCEAARPDLILSLYGERSFATGHLILKGLGFRTALLVLPTYDTWVRRAWWKEFGKRLLFHSADAAKVPGPDGHTYARRYGFTDDRIFEVRQSVSVGRYAMAISCDERAALRRELGISGCVFLYVGRFWHGKGLTRLLDAYGRIAAVNPEVSLLLVGDGPEEATLRTVAAGLRGVRFQPFVQPPELPRYYAACDVFVFPTLGDPHGQVIEEAHAARLPIITSDAAGDIPQRVTDGVSGFVVHAGDVDALARRMIELATDPDLRRAMGARGAERATSWDDSRWADDFERFVTGALAVPRRNTAAARVLTAVGALAIRIGDVAARARRWRAKAGADLAGTTRAIIVDRTNRLGMRLVSLPWRLNRPAEALERFGTKSGGWLLPSGRLGDGGVCYCAGVGEETSLEDDLLRKTTCLVWSFDPTAESAAHVARQAFDPNRFHFVPTGISDTTETLRFYAHPDPQMWPAYSNTNIWNTTSYIEAPATTVAALMETFGHRELTLLKLSIEGAEWGVLRHLLDGRTPKAQVLCVLFSQPASFWRVARAVRDLARHGFAYLGHEEWKFTFVRS